MNLIFLHRIKLSVLFVLLTILTTTGIQSAEPVVDQETRAKRIGLEEFDKIRAGTNVIVLDVRSLAEFEKGRIPGATNIDINSAAFAEKIATLDKSKTYIVNCAVGMRSARACKKMETNGFKLLYDFAPGFDGWKKAGKPIEK